MDLGMIGTWIIENWSSLAVIPLLVGGFLSAWRRQVLKMIIFFLATILVIVVGGLQ